MPTFGNTRTTRTTGRSVFSPNDSTNAGMLIFLIDTLPIAPMTISKFTAQFYESDVPFHIKAFACSMVSATQPGVVYGYSDNYDFPGANVPHYPQDFVCSTPIVIPSLPGSGLAGLGVFGYQYGTSPNYPFAGINANVNGENGISPFSWLSAGGFNYALPPSDLSAVTFAVQAQEQGELFATYTVGGSVGWHGRGMLMGVM